MKDFLFRAVKLNKNTDPERYSYSGCSIGFDSGLLFLVWTIVYPTMAIIREKDILILGEGLTQGLESTTIIAEAKYSIDFTESEKCFKSVLQSM